MRILLWHAHGTWTTAFVQGDHEYLLPVAPGRGRDGRGRAPTWNWPAAAVEVTPADLADAQVDVVILQRPEDQALAESWLGGRRPGRDLPAIWLEHNAPQGQVNRMCHPASGRRDLVVVHVTHTNALFWDCGSTPWTVIEHGVVDPGDRYTGELPAAAVVVNEPGRRARVTGSDLLPVLAGAARLDLFGMEVGRVAADLRARGLPVVGQGNLTQELLHTEMARRRVYLHPVRWTSLGLSLIEAMHLSMPIVALSTTEVPEAVPAEAGVVSNRLDALTGALRRLMHEPEEAGLMGKAARAAALDRYGLARFLADWDRLLEEVVA